MNKKARVSIYSVFIVATLLILFVPLLNSVSYELTEYNYTGVNNSLGNAYNKGMYFKPDGTELYISTFYDDFYQYSCSTPWDITTCSYTNIFEDSPVADHALRGMFFKSDGTKMYSVYTDTWDETTRMYQYSCSSAWDITTCSRGAAKVLGDVDEGMGIFFSPNGAKFFIVDAYPYYSTRIKQYSCSTPWDLYSCSYSTRIDAQDALNPRDISFSEDGKKMYEIGLYADVIFQYSCSSAWSLSTCSYDSLNIPTQSGDAEGIFFSSDNLKFYELAASIIYEYSFPIYFSTLDGVDEPDNESDELNASIKVNNATSPIDKVIFEYNYTTNYTVSPSVIGSSNSQYYFIITEGNYTAHDNVSFRWFSNDTNGNSVWSNIHSFIVANQIPSVSQPAINDTTPETNDLISCNGGTFSDDDAEDVTETNREFKWYDDNVEVGGETSQTLSLSVAGLDKTNVVKCSIRVSDGYDWSSWVNSSNSATIQNSAPTIDNPQTTVSWDANGSTYNYDYDFSDADSDSATWYDNTTLFNINSATGVISDIPTESQVGDYAILISVSDGTVNATDTFTYTINDITPPTSTASATSPPDGAGYTFNTWTGDDVKVTISAFDSGGFDDTSFPVYCADTLNTCNPTTYIATGTTISTEGTSYIRFYSNDTAGNKETTQSKIIKIDTTPPSVSSLTEYPTDPSTYSYGDTYFINATVTDAHLVDTVLLEFDSTNYSTTNVGNVYTLSISGLTAGTYNYRWYANDTFGNMNGTETGSYTINKATPTGSLTSNLGWTIDENQEVVIGLSESNTGDGDLTYIVYRDGVDKGTGETWTPTSGTYDYVLNTTGGSNWTANTSIDTQTLTVNDITLPSITITYPANTTYSTNVSELNYTYIEANPDKCWWSNNSGVWNSSTQVCGTNWTGLISNEGSNTWTIYMNDTSGYENSTSITFFKDTIIPQISIITPSNNTNSTNSQLNINYTASDTNLQSCWWSNNTGTTNYSLTDCTTNITTETWEDGTHTIIIYTNDTLNNQNSSSVTFTIDTTAPSLSIVHPEDTVTYDSVTLDLNYTISDSGIGLDSCWYKNDTGNNITIACGTNTTITQTDGSHTIYMWANDTLGNEVSTSNTYIISTTSPALTLRNPPNNTYSNTNSITFNYTAIDVGGVDTCELWGSWSGGWHLNQSNVHGGDTSVDINEGNFSLDITEGDYIWNVWCNDSGGTGDWYVNNWTLRVDTINPLIEYTTGTALNDTNSTNTWIFVNVSVTETNPANITFRLYNPTGSYNITTYTDGARTINWTNLPDNIYTYNVTISDDTSNSNSTTTRLRRLDDTPPTIVIDIPQAQNYATNDSMKLNYTATDNLIGLDRCWYYIYYTNGTLVKATEELLTCQNDTFTLPGGDNDFTLTLFSRDILLNIDSEVVTFGIRTESPAISLVPVNDTHSNELINHFLNFSVSTNVDSISTCELWGDWTGTWHKNQTMTTVSTTTENSFDSINLSENKYEWNVWCNDSLNISGWGLNNQTYIIDVTNPQLEITYITPTAGTQTFKINTSVSDTYLSSVSCKYTIYDSTGAVDGLNNNVSFNCNEETSPTATSFGTFNFEVYAEDKATNLNQTNETFTLSPTVIPPQEGGGGGPITIIQAVDFSITTTNFLKNMDISLAKDSTKPRRKAFYITNKGIEEITVSLECDTIDVNKSSRGIKICDYVTFLNDSITILPTEEIREIGYIEVMTPEDAELGDKYYFNILAKEGEATINVDKLSVSARVSVLSMVYKWKGKDGRTPIAGIAAIISIILFTVSLIFFARIKKLAIGSIVSVIILIGSFFLFLFIL